MPKNKTLHDVLSEMFPQHNATSFTAMAVLLDNHMTEAMTVDDWRKWNSLADCIAAGMRSSDDPRFSLYDFLDAAINHPTVCDWHSLLQEMKKDSEEFFSHMTTLAEDKRRTYEG